MLASILIGFVFVYLHAMPSELFKRVFCFLWQCHFFRKRESFLSPMISWLYFYNKHQCCFLMPTCSQTYSYMRGCSVPSYRILSPTTENTYKALTFCVFKLTSVSDVKGFTSYFTCLLDLFWCLVKNSTGILRLDVILGLRWCLMLHWVF